MANAARVFPNCATAAPFQQIHRLTVYKSVHWSATCSRRPHEKHASSVQEINWLLAGQVLGSGLPFLHPNLYRLHESVVWLSPLVKNPIKKFQPHAQHRTFPFSVLCPAIEKDWIGSFRIGGLACKPPFNWRNIFYVALRYRSGSSRNSTSLDRMKNFPEFSRKLFPRTKTLFFRKFEESYCSNASKLPWPWSVRPPEDWLQKSCISGRTSFRGAGRRLAGGRCKQSTVNNCKQIKLLELIKYVRSEITEAKRIHVRV